MLRLFFSICLLPAFVTSVKCLNCATIGLLNNWQLTGYPNQPDNLVYDNHTIDCPTKTCVEIVIPTGPNTYEMLRGCHGAFTGNNENYTQTVSEATPAATKCTQMKIDGRGTNAISFCTFGEANINACNSYIAYNPATGTVTVAGVGDSVCPDAPLIDCVQCSYLDGKGKKCKKTEDGSGRGASCALTTGKLNGHDYQESAPAFLLPTNRADSCLTINSNQTQYYNSGFGTSISKSKRSVNEVFIGKTCYCQTTGCNSAPTVLATSMTLVVVLALVPFFC